MEWQIAHGLEASTVLWCLPSINWSIALKPSRQDPGGIILKEVYKLTVKFMWNCKRYMKAKLILKKDKVEGINYLISRITKKP